MLEKSESIKEIAGALVKFQNEVTGVKKDGSNPFFKSKYATLDNFITTVRTPMVKHGLSFTQLPSGENELVTMLMHESGEYLSATAKMAPKTNDPQGQGSAITYMRRYALGALLGIATEDDDDGNSATRTPYDTSEVPDNAKVTVSGADTSPKKKLTPPKSVAALNAKKKQIKDLIDSIALTTLDTKEEYETYVLDNTGFELIADNYDEIITKLTKIQHGKII